MEDLTPEQLDDADEERHAANLELFVDLVFVFAVAQVTSLIASGADAVSFGRGVLLAWLVWWLWSQFAWLGAAVELGRRSRVQLMVLATVPLALLVATAIPGAFGADGVEFAAAYLAVNLWTLTIQARQVWFDVATRRAFLTYLPLAALGPMVLLAGAFLEPTARTIVWGAVAAFNIGAALMAGSGGSDGANRWEINPSHFVERHSLVVIIVLGEILVAVGAAASGSAPLRWEYGLGVLTAATGACAYWWAYFTYIPGVLERSLRGAVGPQRGRVARDLLTFLHFPVILGMLLFAVAAKHGVGHPTDVLEPFDRVALGASVVALMAGFAAMQLRVAGRISPERVVAMVAGALWAWIGGSVAPAWAMLLGAGAIVWLAQLVTVRRLDRLGSLDAD
jgi:low temperature requirement protein LtrA